METPLFSRRITRSQASVLGVKNHKGLESEECNNGLMKSRQRKNSVKHQEKEGSALIDITNGSPIVGLAMGSLKTPSSRCSKKHMIVSKSEAKSNMTPGSGESLLRGQVKTLLQKVEEEGFVSKTCFEYNPWCYIPTPANTNTPQVNDFSTSGNDGLKPLIVPPVVENSNFTQMLNEVMSAQNLEDKGENVEKNVITRSLFSDFTEKSNDSDSNESMWSVQVNASTSDEYRDCEDVVDELCEGMSKISVNKAAKFTGKHIRFVYNSDGELEGEVSSSTSSKAIDTRRESFEVESEEERGV